MSNVVKKPTHVYDCFPDHDISMVHGGGGGGRTKIGGPPLTAMYHEVMQRQEARFDRFGYVHIPYCSTRCKYCGFYKYPITAEHTDLFVELLCVQLKAVAEFPYIKVLPFKGFYFGGGTPTALSVSQLDRILTILNDSYTFVDDREITVESSIQDLDDEKIALLKAQGVQRLSIGVQTFNEGIRRYLGRRAPVSQMVSFLRKLWKNGFTVAIDLLYGLPGQTMELWKEDVKYFVVLGIDGISPYGLRIFPQSPLKKEIDSGQNPPIVGLPEKMEMFLWAREHLLQNGFRQIGVDHFGRNRERNEYLLAIYHNFDISPFGMGAGGKIDRLSFFNTLDFNQYEKMVSAGDPPVMGGIVKDENAVYMDYLNGQILTGCCDIDKIDRLFQKDTRKIFGNLIEDFQQRNLLRLQGDILSLTDWGCCWHSRINTEFGNAFDRVFSPSKTTFDFSSSGDHPAPHHPMIGTP